MMGIKHTHDIGLKMRKNKTNMGGHTPFYVLDDRGRETLMNCKTERACQMAWKRDQAAAARFGIPEAKIIAMWLVTDPRPPEAQAFLENKREMDDYRKIGKSIGINWNNVSFTVAQFKKGLHTEMKEHHDDQETKVVTTAEEAGKIAWAHLKEDDKYYDKLAKMEESAGLKAILLKIESKIVTIDDFNELIQEATPESMRDRLRRRINVNQDTVRSHQDEDGHAKMSLPVMADRVQPKRKRADRTQMQHGGKMGHRHSARTQKRTMSKSLREAIEFFKGNIGRPIDQSLSTDISHTVLRNVATKLMGKPGINRDWLYNFCSSLSESVDDSGYNLQVVGEDCEPRNQADVICAEHSVQTAWAGEKQFAWESATQKHDDQEFSHDVSKWIEITGWTRRELYNWLGY